MLQWTGINAQLIALSIVVALGLTTSEAPCQEVAGRLTGQVVDEADNVLPDARVLITNLQFARVTNVYTDRSGSYQAEVEPGIYSIRFEAAGFAGLDVPYVEIRLGRTVILGATLRVGSVMETVDVTGDNVRLSDPGTMGRRIAAAEIDRLPKARSFQSLALLAPFVNQGELEGGIQVNGASGAENAFAIDGINTTSVINGSSRQNTVFEYIQEVQVKTTSLAAEFNGALGGVISAVTKSGGNHFTGEAHDHLGGSALNSAPPQRLTLDPTDDRTVAYVQDEEHADFRSELGGSFGGPFVHDRLFFFGSLTAFFERRTGNYIFSSGAERGSIRQTVKWLQAFGKLSVSTRRMLVDVTGVLTPAHVLGSLPMPVGGGANWISSSNGANEGNRGRGSRQHQVGATARARLVVSKNVFAALRGGLFNDRYSDRGIPAVTSYVYQTVASASLGLPESLQGPVGIQNAPRAPITSFDATSRIQLNADVTYVFGSIGRHTVKAGVGYQRTRNRISSLYPGGYVDIFWGLPAILPGQVPDGGAYGYYTVNNRGTSGAARAETTSLYVQDWWQLAARLTVNLGVRAEDEKVPAYTTSSQKYVVVFPFGQKVAPRLSLAYDLYGNGRLRLFMNWGRYVDWTKFGMSRTLFGGSLWCTYYRAIDDPEDAVNASLSSMRGRNLWNGAGECRDRSVPKFDAIDPDLKPMSQLNTSAGLDLMITPSTVGTVRYVHNRLVRAVEDLVALVDGRQKYLIANPGEGVARITPAIVAPLTRPFPTPTPKRQYDGIDFGISHHFTNNSFGAANLSISRLHGNYAGLASSDEIRTPAMGVTSATAQQQAGSLFREGGNVNRGWDLDDAMFDSHGNLDVRGRLATDRPVVAKLYGAYNVARHTQIGAFVYVGSGTPISTYVNTVNQTEIFVEGRGDMGRTPVLNKTDLLVSHELPMSGNKRLRLELNVINLFNQKTSRHVFNYLNRGAGNPRASAAIDFHNIDLFKGYDYNALIGATPEGQGAYDPRYGMDDLFEAGTQGQVSVKFLF